MRTQRTQSQRYIAAHAAVLVTRAEKLSRRYLRAGDRVLVYCNTAAHVHTARYGTYVRARAKTERNGTNGTERITSVFNWERYKRNGITRKRFLDSSLDNRWSPPSVAIRSIYLFIFFQPDNCQLGHLTLPARQL